MFTHDCFIRKNSEYLRKKLNELGYTCFGDVVSFRFLSTNIYFNNGILYYEYVNFYYGFNFESTFHSMDYGFIDCGTNEELFLAIAALRDDSDKHQWFTNDVFWIKCSQLDLKHELDNNYEEFCVADFHKATVQELIEHFNK